MQVQLTDRDHLKLWSSCFPPVEFETFSLSWSTTKVKGNSMSKDLGLVARLEVGPSAFERYEPGSDGSICVFSEPFTSALDFGLRQRHETNKVTATWRVENSRLRLRVDVEGLGSLGRSLGHVPDALLPPQKDPTFQPGAEA